MCGVFSSTSCITYLVVHDDVIKWKHFPRYWPFARGIHRRGDLMFSLICAWINGRVNNRETVDLRRRGAHYDVIVMICNVDTVVLSMNTHRYVYAILHISVYSNSRDKTLLSDRVAYLTIRSCGLLTSIGHFVQRWPHQMETFSALLAFCQGNWPVTGEFPVRRLVTRSFDVFFDLNLNRQLSKQWRRWWFETLSRSLWRHCNVSDISASAE